MADRSDRIAMLSDLEALEARLVARFDGRLDARLEARLNYTLAEVRVLIAEEGVTTRRHFDIMVERMAELMKPLAGSRIATAAAREVALNFNTDPLRPRQEVVRYPLEPPRLILNRRQA
jgi:hypothetical protein